MRWYNLICFRFSQLSVRSPTVYDFFFCCSAVKGHHWICALAGLMDEFVAWQHCWLWWFVLVLLFFNSYVFVVNLYSSLDTQAVRVEAWAWFQNICIGFVPVFKRWKCCRFSLFLVCFESHWGRGRRGKESISDFVHQDEHFAFILFDGVQRLSSFRLDSEYQPVTDFIASMCWTEKEIWS